MFETGEQGLPSVLTMLLEGWEVPRGYVLRPNKRVYARVLYYGHGWSRQAIMQALNFHRPAALNKVLEQPWKGAEHVEVAEIAPEPVEEPDWRQAYESSRRREKVWRDRALKYRTRLRRVEELATRLCESHPSNQAPVRNVGDRIRRVLEGDIQ